MKTLIPLSGEEYDQLLRSRPILVLTFFAEDSNPPAVGEIVEVINEDSPTIDHRLCAEVLEVRPTETEGEFTVELRWRDDSAVADTLRSAGFCDFIGPLIRRGFKRITPENNPGHFQFLKAQTRMNLEEGTVIEPTGFGNYADCHAEAMRYKEALEFAGYRCLYLEIPRESTRDKCVMVFVFPKPLV